MGEQDEKQNLRGEDGTKEGMSEKMVVVVAPDSLGQSWRQGLSCRTDLDRHRLPTVFLIRTFSVYINADSPFITMS